MPVCLFVCKKWSFKPLHWTDIVLLYSEASHTSKEGLEFFFGSVPALCKILPCKKIPHLMGSNGIRQK